MCVCVCACVRACAGCRLGFARQGGTIKLIPNPSAPADSLDDEDEVLWALAEQLGLPDFVAVVGGPQYAHTLLVSGVALTLDHTHHRLPP